MHVVALDYSICRMSHTLMFFIGILICNIIRIVITIYVMTVLVNYKEAGFSSLFYESILI